MSSRCRLFCQASLTSPLGASRCSDCPSAAVMERQRLAGTLEATAACHTDDSLPRAMRFVRFSCSRHALSSTRPPASAAHQYRLPGVSSPSADSNHTSTARHATEPTRDWECEGDSAGSSERRTEDWKKYRLKCWPAHSRDRASRKSDCDDDREGSNDEGTTGTEEGDEDRADVEREEEEEEEEEEEADEAVEELASKPPPTAAGGLSCAAELLFGRREVVWAGRVRVAAFGHGGRRR